MTLAFRIVQVLGLVGVLAGLLIPVPAQAQQGLWVMVDRGMAIRVLTPEARRAEESLFRSDEREPGPDQPCQNPQNPAQNPLIDQTDGQPGSALQVEQRRRISRSYNVPRAGRPFARPRAR